MNLDEWFENFNKLTHEEQKVYLKGKFALYRQKVEQIGMAIVVGLILVVLYLVINKYGGLGYPL